LGCGKTKFETDYRFHSADDPFVKGTEIPRLKALPLGERNIGFLEHEADALIDALAELRDAEPQLVIEPARGSTKPAAAPSR
jgi:hypothetical protein